MYLQTGESLHNVAARILDMHALQPSHINCALNNRWDNRRAAAVFASMVAATCTACAAESPPESPEAIDHADIIRSWNAESLARGKTVQRRRMDVTFAHPATHRPGGLLVRHEEQDIGTRRGR
jgi:hypothetical protein